MGLQRLFAYLRAVPNPRKRTPRRRVPLSCEALESRQLLSSIPFVITNQTGQTVNFAMYGIDNSSGKWSYFRDTGAANNTFSGALVAAESLGAGNRLPTYSFNGTSAILNLPDTSTGISSAALVLTVGAIAPNITVASNFTLPRPAPSNPTLVNATTNPYYDYVEFTLDGSNTLHINTTQVDQFGFPITLSANPTPSSAPVGVTPGVSRAAIFQAFASFLSQESDSAAQDYLPLLQSGGEGSPYRIIAPGQYLATPGNSSDPLAGYFDNAIQSFFTAPPALTLSASGITLVGTATAHNPVASGDWINGVPHTNPADNRDFRVIDFVAQPGSGALSGQHFYVYSPIDPPSWVHVGSAGEQVFANNGVFADNGVRFSGQQSSILGNLENQVVSALTRGIANLPTPAGYANTTAFWTDPAQAFPDGEKANLYAKFLHTGKVNATDIFIGGRVYSFPYSDQGDQASFFAVPNPASVSVTLGPWSDTPAVGPVITSGAASTTASVGSVFSYQFAAMGSPTPTLSASGLPAWLSFNGSTGILTGTPSSAAAGTSVTITLTASNGTLPNAVMTFTINVVPATVPTLVVSNTSLALGATTAGTAGMVQSFTVNGSNLASPVIVAAPAGVQLSVDGTTWNSTVTLPANAGTVATTAVHARIAASVPAGSISGNISVTSTGAPARTIAVNGTVAGSSTALPIGDTLYLLSRGTLSSDPGTGARSDTIASAGGTNHDGTPSNARVYEVQGLTGTYDPARQTQFALLLDAGREVANGTQVRVSYDFNGDRIYERVETYRYFAENNLPGWETYTQTKGVRTAVGSFADFQNGSVRVDVWNAIGTAPVSLRTDASASDGLQSKIVIPFTNLTRTNGTNVVPTLTGLSVGLAPAGSPPLPITLSGSNFNASSTAFFNGTPLATTWISATQLSAVIPSALLTTPGAASIAVSNPGPGGGTSTALSFTITAGAVPTLQVSPSSLALGSTTTGTAGAGQTFSVGGSNLTGNLLITTPAGVELSTEGTTWGTSLTLTPSGNGTVAPTNIYARITAAALVGGISGTIAVTSIGAPAKTVAVAGTVNSGGTAPATVTFAVIGDYGNASSGEASVANLVKSWNPAFIVTTGDNNYGSGSASTIDKNIGQFYHDYIGNYTGAYGAGSASNRFFPSLGNHDWDTANAQPYLDYFTLPGNERYYQFTQGPIEFFIVDSDTEEPDGTSSNSVQGRWLQSELADSTAVWKLVFLHHSPYSSGPHGSNAYMQWPFQQWGASAVLSGHDHIYERLIENQLPYFVNGLGGSGRYTVGTPVAGSQVRYSDDYGAMRVQANDTQMSFEFITQTGSVIDRYTIYAGNVSPTITSAPAPSTATVGSLYSYRLTASGAPTPTLSASALPAWLTFDPSTGILRGTPSAADAGTRSTIALTAGNGALPNAVMTFTVDVAPAPVASLAVSPAALDLGTTTAGTAGAVQAFTVSGSQLSGSILVTAPPRVEVSRDGTNFSSVVNLAPDGAAIVAATTIYVRTAATAPVGTMSGSIAVTSPGATPGVVAVRGSVAAVGSFSNTLYLLGGATPALATQPGTTAQADTIASAAGVNHDGTPTNARVYQINGLTGIYDPTKQTQFSLFVDSGSQVANGTQVRVSYDFNGDGIFDRVETYRYFAEDDRVGWEAYTQSAGVKNVTGSFANMSNGSVKVEVWNAIGRGPVTLRTDASATDALQSQLWIPFKAG